MRYKRILLVRLAYVGYLENVDILPVGIAFLAQVLEQRNIEYDYLDLGLQSAKEELNLLKKKISYFNPDLLAISMMTLGYKGHYELFNKIKRIFPGLDIVAGGPHISTFRGKVLEECAAINYGVIHDGEFSLAALCEGRNLSEINGLIYRINDRVVLNGSDNFISDLNSVPYPIYSKLNLEDYNLDIPLVTSRGCPYNCNYCPVKLAIGDRFRFRSAGNLLDEVIYWYKKGIKNFSIWDDNFTLLPERVTEFCNLIMEHNLLDIRIAVPNGIRADRVTKDMLVRMKEAGFYQLSFGVESASNKVLKNIQKGETIEQIREAVSCACDLGYEVTLFMLIGSPAETPKDFMKSLEFAQEFAVAESRFYTIIPFPGTELFDWIKKNGYFLREPEEYLNSFSHFLPKPCFFTPEMSEIERIHAFHKGLRVTISQRRKFRMRQYMRFGRIVSWIIAYLSTTDLYRNIFKSKRLRRHVVYPIKKFLSYRNFDHSGRNNFRGNTEESFKCVN